jgi:putative DNA primase/helicase
MGQVALQYARRGWPVFPCRECDGAPYKRRATGETATPRAKAPYTGTGLKDATTDEQRILAWWRSYPNALIGLPAGSNGCFVLDFDPRHDEATGEIFTLERLKADLEAQMGCELPRSLTAYTPSGGVHVYFKQPSDGDEIRNRGNLPMHVDVRGRGGYVIAPPSEILAPAEHASLGQYRWLDRGDWRDDAAIMEAPAELIAILRAPKERATMVGSSPSSAAAPAAVAPRRPPSDDPVERARSSWARAAFDREIGDAEKLGQGQRNVGISATAIRLGAIVGAGYLSESMVKGALYAVAELWPDVDKTRRSIDTALAKGIADPRDMGDIGVEASRHAARAAAAPRAPVSRAPDRSFRDGREEPEIELDEGQAVRLKKWSAAWMARRLEYVPAERDAILRLAYSIGMRVGGGWIDGSTAKEALWAVYETVADVQHADIDQALDDGALRGYDLGRFLLLERCVRYPMTDFGIAERFRDRFGDSYRFTTGKGWLGWDGRRWKVLDQDEKTPPAEVVSAVFETVRAVQDEARYMGDTGVKVTEDDLPDGELYLDKLNPHGLDKIIPKGKTYELLSTVLARFGRQSETAGKPVAIANLARRWLTAPIEQFDHDPFAFNVMNGTLRFRREEAPDGTIFARVELEPHDRSAMLTKLSPVEFDPAKVCPRYDKMFAWAQPDRALRRYLHMLGGYTLTGDAGEQKLWFWYGRGRNGKGTTLDVWQHVIGDYADNIPIGSFLDQGIKKRGDQASPDLAKLAGVRLLRSSEPGRNEKLDSGLIKLVTGGDLIPVRMLHRGFFNLKPLFKLIIMGNSRFDIPDTDDGIWSRMKLVPWLRNIEKPEPGVADWPEKDPALPAKIIAEEASGVLNRLVEGLLDYLTNGLVEPSSVTEATAQYRDASDPIERFMRMCTELDADSSVQSSKLHEVFVAWARAAGEREWSNKGFSNALAEKGFEKHRSNGMQWLGFRLIKDAYDFVDSDGKVRKLDEQDDLATPPDDARSPDPPAFDDDLPP